MAITISHVFLQNNMEDPRSMHDIAVIWRGKKFTVQMIPSATLKDLGHELQNLTRIKADTMRFIVPQSSNKSSKLLTPFSNEHERLSLQETSIAEVSLISIILYLEAFHYSDYKSL